MISPIQYEGGVLRLLDQRILPHVISWIECRNVNDVACAIETMVVRGAPAIGCTAAFGLAVDVFSACRIDSQKTWKEYKKVFFSLCERLASTRPTAVNLFFAIEVVKKLTHQFNDHTSMDIIKKVVEQAAVEIFENDLNTCKAIGQNGLTILKSLASEKPAVLTHCNAGGLATAGYGTALGVIRAARDEGKDLQVYVDETRPVLQGARLTAWELMQEGIPCTLITDNMAGFLMQQGKIDLVIVGADRIAANGDTANKIGTYSLAVLAKEHGIPFYVAAPLSTVDFSLATGAGIPIEERDREEVTHLQGVATAPSGVAVYNPAFDVTPHRYITAIITETDVQSPPLKQD